MKLNDRPRPKRPLSIGITDDMRDRLEELAEERHISLGEVVRQLLDDALQRMGDNEHKVRRAGT